MHYDQTVNLLRIRAHSLTIDYKFLQAQVSAYQDSPEYKLICKAYEYYEHEQDIMIEGRKQLGANGYLEPATNAIDKRLTDNQFAKCIDQKRNYLFGRDFSLEGEKSEYIMALNHFFDQKLRTLIKKTATDALLGTESYWHPYYDNNGKLRFKRWDRRQILVLWNDDDKEEPHSFIRFYDTAFYNGLTEKRIRHIDYYTPQGVMMWEDGVPVTEHPLPYTYANDQPMEFWEGKLPLIVWRQNPVGRLLIRGVKELQDALNELRSQITNIALEDARTTILHVENYGGEMEQDGLHKDRKTLRKVIAESGLICTETVDGVPGGVSTLTLEFEPEKRLLVADMLKKVIIDNMRAFDVKDLRDMSAPNQMNIKAVYSDLAEDALEMETLFKQAFQDLLYFINRDLGVEEEEVTLIFNTDMMMNESEIIQDINNSRNILSHESLVAQHPWVKEVEPELERIQKERQQSMDELFERQGTDPSFPVRNDETS